MLVGVNFLDTEGKKGGGGRLCAVLVGWRWGWGRGWGGGVVVVWGWCGVGVGFGWWVRGAGVRPGGLIFWIDFNVF